MTDTPVQRTAELMLCDQLRSIADVRPMSASTRTRLRDLANKVETVERDRNALIAIMGGPYQTTRAIP